MLRTLTLFLPLFMYVDGFCSQDIKSIDSKINTEIKNQVDAVKKSLTNANALEKDSTFLKNLEIEKEAIKNIKYGSYKFPNIKEVKIPKIDFDKITSRNNSVKRTDHNPTLFAFISLGMPENTIINILKEAKELKAKVYLRGVKKDLKTTIKIISDLSQKSGGSVLIDPTMFKKFNIDRVPAYVIAEKEPEASKYQSSLLPSFVKAYGDVTIEYFIDYIKRNGTKSQVAMANLARGLKK
ncbi:MAG: type-F conjugative transfer system pilin assembly protein TrbC [Halobacteriovoraceae bacterium]|nr:type-F conjugative transfer system pilin assembly protein TrbC [Halobacteriovoraceae bacterium]